MRFSKFAMIFVAMLLCVFMASTAMAIVVTNRSAEMDDFSPCDRGGTIEMALTQNDWNLITAHLAANDYARIRIALNGLSLPPSPMLPTLCVSIRGTVDGSGLGALGGDIPDNTVALRTIGVEVSDVDSAGADGFADVEAYVIGTIGNQYIEVYIVALDGVAGDFDFDTDPPWFKIGLYDELIDAGDVETTQICAQVLSFSGVSTLTISNEAQPNTLTFSGDNEIGHFPTITTTVRDCDEFELVDCPDTATIELCPLGSVQGECPTYYKCFTIEGDIPESGTIQLYIRTNGAYTNANDQEGVYLQADPVVRDESGNLVVPTAAWVYYTSSGRAVTDMPCTIWESEYAVATFDAADFEAAGNEIRVCLPYVVNPDEAVAGTDVIFWVTAGERPCGSIVSGSLIGATLIECALSVSVSCTPDAYSFPQGGKLGYYVTVTNNTDSTQCFSYWTNVTLPSGKIYPASGFLFGPKYVCLSPYVSKSAHISHNIPVSTKPGDFVHHAYVGPQPTVWDDYHFNFTVTEAMAAEGPMGWKTTVDENFAK